MPWRLGWGACVLKAEGGSEYIYLYVQGDRFIDKIYENLVSFNKNHLTMQGYDYRIYLGYIQPGIEQNSVFRHESQ